MNDSLKSAWEIALERLRERGIEDGDGERLSDDQKRRIAEAREDFAARRAELRFGHQREVEALEPSAAENPGELQRVREAYEQALAGLVEEEKEAVRRIRAETSGR